MKKPPTASAANHAHCAICRQPFPTTKLMHWGAIRPEISDLISKSLPTWSEGMSICKPDLIKFRQQYIEELLQDERGELRDLDRQVIASLEAGQFVSRNIADEIEQKATFGERTADKVAEFGGSWTFILSFAFVLIAWICLNALALGSAAFDPYPFILLNLVLSCLAALQAPIIMMSQRRQETKDRLRAENDYRVNLKAELEIRQLHEKLDHQLAHQWEKLAKLQQIQIEILEENADARR